ncbi:WhiB family transcriptional regulator [Bowdeniella nasicola]|uniref:WhiB family transcriptional regulator n=1 Tax=Bowdeniella nasicola TaxID=208480 RepID=UPI002481BDE1|nr:WhiB family transcriptional regulator [Bowdeniella nasicola]
MTISYLPGAAVCDDLQQLNPPCASAPELFFAERMPELKAAQALCAECPLRQDCLSAAQQRAEPWGVWGGEIFHDGAIVAFKRGRGRPPKTECESA